MYGHARELSCTWQSGGQSSENGTACSTCMRGLLLVVLPATLVGQFEPLWPLFSCSEVIACMDHCAIEGLSNKNFNIFFFFIVASTQVSRFCLPMILAFVDLTTGQ